VIGRVSCIAVDPRNPKHLLVGAAAGGIWESKDTGATWNPRTDEMPSLAIGAIAFDPQGPKNVYAGSGEGNSYSNLGAGIYKSTDGGTNWSVLTQRPFLGVGFYDLVVDPRDSAVLYAATTNGFFASTTGGSSWTRKRAEQCWDISLHPAGGATAEILAAFSDGLFVSTSAGNGVHSSEPTISSSEQLGPTRGRPREDSSRHRVCLRSRCHGTPFVAACRRDLDKNQFFAAGG
jgi:photosystem II stability/assembly factor-like uncharacterized protein